MTLYKPIGDDKQGYKLTIPAKHKRADYYQLAILPVADSVYLPAGTLIYTPVRT